MIIKQYIKEFEKLGFGMFVHFGAYSVLGRGEWAKKCLGIPDKEYDLLLEQFNPKLTWAKELVLHAKKAGCRYITLTTRHHDGFSLYDTCGLSDYDAVHAKCGRDLVREFVDACHEQGIIPFFYHTLLDWHEEHYQTDFPEYLKYLRRSIEILCTNYGKIGGLWFDGMWDKKNSDWEEDAFYATIRKYQPEAMIINNTGLSAQGALGHIELDSVTFERGKPKPLNMESAPKYVASEMCEVFCNHWGYAEEDYNYKSSAEMICKLAACRRYGANMLINVGPKPDGTLPTMDAALLEVMGEWVKRHEEALRCPRPTDIIIDEKPDDFVLRDGNTYYLFCHHLPMSADVNVEMARTLNYTDAFRLSEPIDTITWMDNGETVQFTQEGDKVSVQTASFAYGKHWVVRIAKITCKPC